jgi:FAD/FMN-containing dehydrogenase/SAM-dependent methyltransferase
MTAVPSTVEIPSFAGAVTRPGDPLYDELRAVWNVMHDRRPALIAHCRSAQDVAAAIAYGRARDLPIAIRAGGHSLPGHSTVDDGLVLDLRPLDSVGVDPDGRRVRVGGGAVLGEVDRAAQAHGLVVPAGVVSHTGAGGLTLGGGVGRLMRRFGLTIDSLLSAEVVLADGRIVRASEDEHPDLFWGLRGGGGNFGVVTELEFRAHELSVLPILATFHPLERAREVLRLGERLMAAADAPDELLWTSFLRRGPEFAPWMTSELAGTRGIMSLIEWSGNLEAGRALLEQIREELDPPVGELAEVPYLAIQQITDELLAPGTLHAYVKAGFAGELTEEFMDALIDRGSRVGSPMSVIEVLSMGGAIRRIPDEATAFPHRAARWLINVPGQWSDAAESEREIEWVRETFAALGPHLSGGSYSNFMEDDEAGSATVAYGATLTRLAQIKAVYDPENIFRLNQNIVPAAQIPAPGSDTEAKRRTWEATQRELWGRRPEDWSQLAEPQNLNLFRAVLDAAGVGPGTDLLDIGCGSGLALSLAAQRGARTAGIDIAPSLLAVARERVPDADLREGGLDVLPFADAAFDVVSSVNALQFAADPARALHEVRRVLRPGGRLALAQFAAPERVESTALHEAMEALIPSERRGDHAPYALSAEGALERALAEAGLTITLEREVLGEWRYADQERALRGLLCSGGGTRAVRIAGEAPVRAAVTRALGQFRTEDGAFVMHNLFRLVVAERPS